MNFDRVEQALTRARFHCHRFATGQDAAQWLAAECSGKTVGIGGSMTAKAMKLEELLPRTSTVYWHWLTPGPETLANAATAQVYLTSVNALAETGELINIDGTGNRISAATGAHERVYYLVGRNKLAETFDKALWRARNIASPLNARRLNRETPCVKNELKCYDCNSPLISEPQSKRASEIPTLACCFSMELFLSRPVGQTSCGTRHNTGRSCGSGRPSG